MVPRTLRSNSARRRAAHGVEPEFVPVEVPAGGGAFHAGWTWHGSGPMGRRPPAVAGRALHVVRSPLSPRHDRLPLQPLQALRGRPHGRIVLSRSPGAKTATARRSSLRISKGVSVGPATQRRGEATPLNGNRREVGQGRRRHRRARGTGRRATSSGAGAVDDRERRQPVTRSRIPLPANRQNGGGDATRARSRRPTSLRPPRQFRASTPKQSARYSDPSVATPASRSAVTAPSRCATASVWVTIVKPRPPTRYSLTWTTRTAAQDRRARAVTKLTAAPLEAESSMASRILRT